MGFRKAVVLLFGAWLSTACVIAQEPAVDPAGTQVATEQSPASAENADALRKAAQNPIASLISVPVQNNSNFGVGSDDRIQDVLNIQPVIPVPLSKKLNMIARIITPIVYQPTTNQPTDQGAYGFGDLNPTFFFAPSKASRLIWGVGPAFVHGLEPPGEVFVVADRGLPDACDPAEAVEGVAGVEVDGGGVHHLFAAAFFAGKEGIYRVGYHCESREDLDAYLADHAYRLRSELAERFPSGIVTERQVLDIIALFPGPAANT